MKVCDNPWDLATHDAAVLAAYTISVTLPKEDGDQYTTPRHYDACQDCVRATLELPDAEFNTVVNIDRLRGVDFPW